ncbi:MAG: hypothetical protein VB034_00220 [Eubacteriales bacterium]|nr:hypothetical protein [Eubacteriales bacterium]
MKQDWEAEVRRYHSITDDFVESENQDFRLPENYIWVHTSLPYRFACRCLFVPAILFSTLYCRLFLHIRFVNRSIRKQSGRSGCFLYGNHTQPMGDAVLPMLAFAPKRMYVVASPANLGIPVLGPVLPMLGALPLPDSIGGMKKLREAILIRVAESGCVMFYPEAHVWPWYTKIRPFPASSFAFPVECDALSYCMTTTYQKRKRGVKPGITVYLDGPFYPDHSLPKKLRQEKLRDTIRGCMENRSRNSTYSYIRYEEGEESNEPTLLRG